MLVGVPLFFMFLLVRNRKTLQSPLTMQALGLLYEGQQKHHVFAHHFLVSCVAFDPAVYWFELVDLVHKLILTSCLVFLPFEAQIPFGMACLMVYIIVHLIAR